ncbi:hypothetical protein ACHAXT_012893 [Thalassiosira profunda]
MATPVPPPPPVSMPVWSLACPVPFPITGSGGPPSSMSILTFVTPVSVSSPKLWAVSLYKTSLTRCAFLGVPRSGEEYNDIASISSSVNTAPGFTNNVRRRGSMGEAGVLASSDEAVGWRAKRRAGESLTGNMTSGGGVGILQLMAPDQAKLVSVLGKKTGWDVGGVDKREECAQLGNDWVRSNGATGMPFDVLPNCASYLEVKLKRVVDGGDHDVAICEVTGTGVWAEKSVHWLSEDDAGEQSSLDQSSALYTGQLRDEGII